jgi:hypothetical protein
MPREIHLEELLGKRVTDAAGRDVGRIEEFCVEQRGDDWVVSEYLLGVTGLLERLGVRSVADLIGIPLPKRVQQRVPWNCLDVSDPQHPKLREPATR